MGRRLRISFLPAFFTVLIAAFAVAVVLRIHSHGGLGARSATEPPAVAAAAPTGSGPLHKGMRGTADEDGTTATAGGASPSSASGSPVERIREERYNKLLRAPIVPLRAAVAPGARGSITAPPAAAKAAPPSMLSRFVAPIVKVLGGGSSPSPPGQSASGSAKTDRRDGDVPKDPNSDTTPPQLLSAQFNPPSIHDGEETVLFVTAVDDLSGVRGIAGNVISPAGALQGFAMQRDADGSHYTARIAVPKNGAEGMWRINYLNLTDNASNSTTLSAGQVPATASFRVVSSNADSTPPTLRAIWLDRPSMKAAERNTVFVQADDDKSGVNLVSGVFISPSKLARVGFGCRPPESGNTFACEFVPPANADCGDWQLEQVQLQDKANNMAAVRRDNPIVAAVRVSVLSDQCDSHPPVVQAVTLDRYATPAPGTIVIRVSVADDISGVGSVSGHFVYTGAVAAGNQPPKLWFACSMADAQTWSGTVAIPNKAAIGVWRLEQLQVLDKASNLKIYSLADAVVSAVSFRVQ